FQRQTKQVESCYSRRKFVTTCFGALLSTPYLNLRPAHAANPLVMVTWGGTYQESIEKIWCKPFTAKTGVPVRLVSGPDVAKAKAQVMTGNLEWDILDGFGPMTLMAEADNLWEPLEPDLASNSDLIAKPTKFSLPIFGSWSGVTYVPSRNPTP